MSGKVLTINSNGMTQERPVSFETVAAAEAASFLPDEICSVLETRRFYQFDSGSSETRDGVRVLSPAGGGRLLMAAPTMTDAEVAAAIRTATPSQSGLMSTAYASKLEGISAGADATGFRGNVTDAQMLALSSPAAGQWVHNTDYGYDKYVYNGTFWLGPTDFVFVNKTGASSVLSKTCKVSSGQDFAIANPGVEDSIFLIGTVRTAGVADGGSIVVRLTGKPRKALMQADDDTVRGSILFAYANGECYSIAGAGNNTGGFGITLESKNNASLAYEVWYVPIATEIY